MINSVKNGKLHLCGIGIINTVTLAIMSVNIVPNKQNRSFFILDSLSCGQEFILCNFLWN